VTPALLALLLVTIAVLAWRAVTRDRRDYARFKRLRSTTLRRKVFARWLIESWVVLGGLAAALLLAAAALVPDALRDARGWELLAQVPWDSAVAGWILAGFCAALLIGMVLPVLLLRGKLEEIPAVGDIRALLPRERGELKYGAGLAVTAGIVEELLFRLALPAVLFGVLGSGILAFLLACVLFGLLHIYQGPAGMVFAFVLGLVFTALYLLSGTILLPIVVHALIDLRSLVLIPVALGGAWQAGRAGADAGAGRNVAA
jgi:membrane protease YdiL (CAAX protease family)